MILFCERCKSANVRQRYGPDGEDIIWCVDCNSERSLTGFRAGLVNMAEADSDYIVEDAKQNAFRIEIKPDYGEWRWRTQGGQAGYVCPRELVGG